MRKPCRSTNYTWPSRYFIFWHCFSSIELVSISQENDIPKALEALAQGSPIDGEDSRGWLPLHTSAHLNLFVMSNFLILNMHPINA
jgi:hypothetical protein